MGDNESGSRPGVSQSLGDLRQLRLPVSDTASVHYSSMFDSRRSPEIPAYQLGRTRVSEVNPERYDEQRPQLYKRGSAVETLGPESRELAGMEVSKGLEGFPAI